jgi:branched-chain amino acid transport system substrate-binding protein
VAGRSVRRPFGVALLVAALAAILAGCGSGHRDQPTGRISGDTLTVYVSVPLHGASAVSGTAIANGAQMALDRVHARVGRYRIRVRRIDDSNPTKGGWDPGRTSDSARMAAADPTTIGYIGDKDSGASAISIPVLNRLEIPQVSPTSTAVGLTSGAPGAAPGEPDKYYPDGTRTFARVAPSDAMQAAVQVRLQRDFGCTRTYIVEDGEVDGEDLATSFELAARSGGVHVVATQEFDPRATDYRSLAASIASTGARCVLIAAITDSNAVALTTQLAAALPAVRIFGGGGLAESSYAGGLSAARVIVTSPALGASAYPQQGRAWLAAYARRYGTPEPDAILGYEATEVLLGAIVRATDHGRQPADRSKVVRAVYATRLRNSVLGGFDIKPDGDITLRRVGVWIASDGQLSFWKALRG